MTSICLSLSFVESTNQLIEEIINRLIGNNNNPYLPPLMFRLFLSCVAEEALSSQLSETGGAGHPGTRRTSAGRGQPAFWQHQQGDRGTTRENPEEPLIPVSFGIRDTNSSFRVSPFSTAPDQCLYFLLCAVRTWRRWSETWVLSTTGSGTESGVSPAVWLTAWLTTCTRPREHAKQLNESAAILDRWVETQCVYTEVKSKESK